MDNSKMRGMFRVFVLAGLGALAIGPQSAWPRSPMDFQVAPLASKISIYNVLSQIKEKLRNHPRDIDVLNQWAFVAEYYGFWEETIQARTRLIEEGYGDFMVYVSLGQEYMGLGEFAAGEKHLRQSLSIRPGNVFALYNLGLLFRYKGDFPRSLEFFKRARDVYPEWPEFYYELGNTYVMIKDYDRAIDNYTKSLQLGMHDAALFENLGFSYLGKKEKLKALDYFKQALQKNPSDENLRKLFLVVKRSLSAE